MTASPSELGSSGSDSDEGAEESIQSILDRVRALPEYREYMRKMREEERARGESSGSSPPASPTRKNAPPTVRRDDALRLSGPWASAARRLSLRQSMDSIRTAIGDEAHSNFRCLRRALRAWRHRAAAWKRKRECIVQAANHCFRRACRNALRTWRGNARSRRLACLSRAWQRWAGTVAETRWEAYLESLATEMAHRRARRAHRRVFRAWRGYTGERGRRHAVGREIEAARRGAALATTFRAWRDGLPALRRLNWCESVADLFRRRRLLRGALVQLHLLLLHRCRGLRRAKLFSRVRLWRRVFLPWAALARAKQAARAEAEDRGRLALAGRAWRSWAQHTARRRRERVAAGRALNFRRRRLLAAGLQGFCAALGRARERRWEEAAERAAEAFAQGRGARLRAGAALRRWGNGARAARREAELALRADAAGARRAAAVALPRAFEALRSHSRSAARKRLGRQLADAFYARRLAARALERWRAASRLGLLRRAGEDVASLFYEANLRRRAAAALRGWRSAASEAAAGRDAAAARLRELSALRAEDYRRGACLRSLRAAVEGSREAQASASRRAEGAAARRALRGWRREAAERASRRSLLDQALSRRRAAALSRCFGAWASEAASSPSRSPGGTAPPAPQQWSFPYPPRAVPGSASESSESEPADIVPRPWRAPVPGPRTAYWVQHASLAAAAPPSPYPPSSSSSPASQSRPLLRPARPGPGPVSTSSPPSSASTPTRRFLRPPESLSGGYDTDENDPAVRRGTRAAAVFHQRSLLVRHFLTWRFAALAGAAASDPGSMIADPPPRGNVYPRRLWSPASSASWSTP
eukprot:tig00021435_g21438.t1